jgi:hypothetical protein
MVETCLASMGRSSHQRSLTLSSEPPSSPFSHRLNPLDRSAIFLPPEVAFSVSVHSSTNGYTSSRRRLGVLIGNTTVYGDEIPIHELDTIFEAEGARYLATDSNDDRQSDTSSVLTSPSSLRVGSIGKQLLRDNPSSAAELLTRVQGPKEQPSPHSLHPLRALNMLPRQRPHHCVEIIEDESDLTSTLHELYRLGVVESAPSSPHKSKLYSTSERSEGAKKLLSAIAASLDLVPDNDSRPFPSAEPVLGDPLPRVIEGSPEVREDDERETMSEEMDHPNPLQPLKLFAGQCCDEDLEFEADQTEKEDRPPASSPNKSTPESSPRRAPSRWAKAKDQQLPSSSFDLSSTLPPRSSESSSVSLSSHPQLGRKSGLLEGADTVSLFSSEDLQHIGGGGNKSSSSLIRSQEEPHDVILKTIPDEPSPPPLKIPIPSYTGSEEFVNLSISDNLQKYFTEQIFGHGRPSGEAPYLRYESSPSAPSSSRDCTGYVDIPLEAERLIALYREIAIEISEPETTGPTTKKKSRKSPRKPNQRGGDGESCNSTALFCSLVFALTDINLYVIVDNFSNLQKFADAPIPIVRRVHCIESCRFVFPLPPVLTTS